MNFGRSANPAAPVDLNLAMLQFYGYRASQCFDIFASVFGAQMSSRIIRTLAFQAASPWGTGRCLDFVMPNGRTVASSCDAVAIAPYIDVRPTDTQAAVIRTMTVDQFFRDQLEAVWLPRALQFMTNQATEASRRGKILVAYEGGQSFIPLGTYARDPELNALFNAVTRDPRMYEVYTRYFNHWKNVGGRDFMHFTHIAKVGDGGFGALEYNTQPISEAHKYRAIVDWVAANPKTW